MDTADSVELAAGVAIRAAHPVALLAIKWEAFLDRGFNDPFGSHDLEDLLTLIADSARMLRAALWFDDVLEGTFPDVQRLPAILEGVRARLDRLAN